MAKPKQKVKTPEEECESNLIDARRGFTNPPTLLYKVGDQVKLGALDKCVVTRIEDEGRLLYLHCWCTDNNYGRPVKYEKDMWVQWERVLPMRTQPEPPKISNRDGVLYFSNRTIESILAYFYHSGCDLNPPYQRGIVWDHQDRDALLDSIFDNVDIGKFVFVRRPYTTNGMLHEILDGKQRFTALMDFCESRYKWRGMFYHEMNTHDQNHIDGYAVSVSELQEPTEEQILQVFVRLNSTGRPLDPAHIERVRKMLKETKHDNPA
jgi:hypothetical protein